MLLCLIERPYSRAKTPQGEIAWSSAFVAWLPAGSWGRILNQNQCSARAAHNRTSSRGRLTLD